MLFCFCFPFSLCTDGGRKNWQSAEEKVHATVHVWLRYLKNKERIVFWDFFVHPRVFNSCYLSSVPFPFFLKKKKSDIHHVDLTRTIRFVFFLRCVFRRYWKVVCITSNNLVALLFTVLRKKKTDALTFISFFFFYLAEPVSDAKLDQFTKRNSVSMSWSRLFFFVYNKRKKKKQY